MDDKVVTITFRVWATDESEATALSREIGKFIDEQGSRGHRVTAARLTQALRKWKDNPLVRTTIDNYFT